MAAFDPATLDRWRALAIVDREGTTVGTIDEFYLDRETGYPTWALVNTGLFGTSQTFVPLVHATEISDGLQVPYEKRHIKDTPKVDLHDELSPDEEAALFAHYGVDYQFPPADTEPGQGEPPGPVAATQGRPTRKQRPHPTRPSRSRTSPEQTTTPPPPPAPPRPPRSRTSPAPPARTTRRGPRPPRGPVRPPTPPRRSSIPTARTTRRAPRSPRPHLTPTSSQPRPSRPTRPGQGRDLRGPVRP